MKITTDKKMFRYMLAKSLMQIEKAKRSIKCAQKTGLTR